MSAVDVPVCHSCGNDDGPYDGLCLDCLEGFAVCCPDHAEQAQEAADAA